MIQFNVQDISEYRGQLMGIATLLSSLVIQWVMV